MRAILRRITILRKIALAMLRASILGLIATVVTVQADQRILQDSDMGGAKGRERVDQCLDEIKAFCALPRFAGATPGSCLEGIYATMFDPALFPDSLRDTLSGPHGNVWQYVTGANWALSSVPPGPAVYNPVLACLLSGKRKSTNPCDEPPKFTLTANYDPETDHCSYQLTGHSKYLQQCQLAGNEVALYPEKSGTWSLPGQCKADVPVSCKVWPTNPAGYSYNNKICVDRDSSQSSNPCRDPPKFSLNYTYDADTNYCNYQLTGLSTYLEQCWIYGNEVALYPGKRGGWSLPGQCNAGAPVSCKVWPTNPNGYSYNNKICVNHDAPDNK